MKFVNFNFVGYDEKLELLITIKKLKFKHLVYLVDNI